MAADKNLANNSFESSRSVLHCITACTTLRCANSRAGLGIGSDGAHYIWLSTVFALSLAAAQSPEGSFRVGFRRKQLFSKLVEFQKGRI